MSIMDQLRDLLKEYNIEYENFIEMLTSNSTEMFTPDSKEYIEWKVEDKRYAAEAWSDSIFITLHCLTPEQVIRATVFDEEISELKKNVQYWRNEYESTLNISVAYKNNCEEWKRRYFKLKEDLNR